MIKVPSITATLVILVSFLASLTAAFTTASAADRDEIDHASMQLIAGEMDVDGHMKALLRVKLSDGFKTYWFMPGDGGIPPLISTTQGDVDIHLPPPQRIIDEYGDAVGYKKSVDIPLSITLKEDFRQVGSSLKLDIIIGVCADICIPFITQLDTPILAKGAMAPRQMFSLNDGFAMLPKPFRSDFQADEIDLSPNGDKRLSLSFNVTVPQGQNIDELIAFAAVRGDGNFFSRASIVSRMDKGARVNIPIDSSMDVEHFSGKTLTLLLTSGDLAVEQEIMLP